MPADFPLRRPRAFVLLVSVGIVLWVTLWLVAGNGIGTPWRIGGDARFYVLLASNIAGGHGYTYAGIPSAFRPPLYPLFLAGMMRLAGRYAFAVVRLVQLAAGLLAVWLLAGLASRLLGSAAGRLSVLAGLFLPTIVFFPTVLMTETFAILLTALFLVLVFEPSASFGARRGAWTGLVVGIATLVRFNFGALGIVAAWAVLRKKGWKRSAAPLAAMAATFLMVLAPWLVRNALVFGEPLLGTQGGLNALQGILAPQGRAQPGDAARVRAVSGWVAADLETNNRSRIALGSEVQLDHRAWQETWHEWKAAGWNVLPIEIKKLGYFWLSTDQLFSTTGFPPLLRALRAIAVFLSWAALLLALFGWNVLERAHRSEARLLVAYAVVITVIHLPFIMASRYRIPFISPVIILLAGAGLLDLYRRLRPLDAATAR
jgi:4-amino-4-deoxy-L-arabinose transferase-like glycosyltransferase